MPVMKPAILKALLLWLAILCQPALARELKIIFLKHTPPYVIDESHGIVIDLMREALQPSGYTIEPIPLPIGKGFDLFSKGRVDGTANVEENTDLDVYYSSDFIRYHNKAFALKSRSLRIKNIADLKGKKVVAFQRARKSLGKEFGRTMIGNYSYREMSNQESQVNLLLQGEADIAILDESIFQFFRGKLIAEGKVPATVEVDTFEIFQPTIFKAAFLERKVRNDFNRGLGTLRRNGRFAAIYKQYVEDYFSVKQ